MIFYSNLHEIIYSVYLQNNNLLIPTDSYISNTVKEISSFLFDFHAVACDYYDTTEMDNVVMFNSSLKKFYYEYIQNTES